MGNGYFRTSQTSTTSRQRDKRGKDSYSYQHNYVDRVRLEDTNGNHYKQQQHQQPAHHYPKTTHDPHCPQLRAAGWRHTHKSVSHLDLATSCHGAAGAGIDRQRRQLQVQLHHHHHQTHHHPQHHPQPPLTPHAQPHWTQCRVGIATAPAGGQGQLRNARSLDYTQLEREENALDIAEFYWRFDAEAPLEQLDNYAVNDNFEPAAAAAAAKATSSTATAPVAATATAAGTTSTAAAAVAAAVGGTVTATFLDFGSDSCSLRRSRSLAVIREETFSDLQIGSANSSRRRSQLIPRARLVNHGFFRESPRLNSKQQQQVHSEQPTEPTEDTQSTSSGVKTCDSHEQQQQQLQKQQQQQQQLQKQQHRHHHCPQRLQRDSHDFDVYYDNLKRLDALALGLSEQLHPWHNDKSDLESLNSDYFKNSLHQNHTEQQHSSLEFDALEQAVTLLSERPRIYQSRRQQQQNHQHRSHHYCQQQQQRHIDLGGESCPEHSQSSVFPETTTSNSDDQTDTPSLSEQEYDLTHIEQIFQQSDAGEVEESYELISLTTTTRTRFESSEDDEEVGVEQAVDVLAGAEDSLTTLTETTASDSDATLKRTHSEQLDKFIAYDSVYLSSEDSSECTLVGESSESFEQHTFNSCTDSGELEARSLLQISIEDTVYEPQPKQHKKEEEERQKEKEQLLTSAKVDTQVFTQVLKIEPATSSSHINVGVTSSVASKPRILTVVEKRKLRQEELKQPAPPELKRQATDIFVDSSSHKSNLTENQYHSLPDVNISVSLKASETIDKELRTSYNLQRQQQRKESKRQKGEVTRAETYDSIRRFGRAHQKARQKENEEREKQREKEEATQVVEKETKQQPEQNQVAKKKTEKSESIESEVVVIQVEVQEGKEEENEEEEEEQPLPPPPPPITEDEFNDSQNDNDNGNANDNQSVSLSHPEQPREAPVIEIANFSKLIERRAQELRQRTKEQTEELEKQQQHQQQTQSFRIIVTDAHNNIIQTEAIHEEQTKPVTPTSTTTSVSSSSSAASKVLTNFGHTHSQRSLRRSNSSACGKPPERRVLSAGASIYKARPIKVLATAGSDSLGRQKMSRPQILHVVDSSTSSSSGSSNNSNSNLRRRSSARSIASNVSGEVATEYLQKVDAVKCYWNKLAGNEPAEKPDEEPDKVSRLHFQLGNKVTPSNGEKPASNSLDYCSIMPPSIEIVELGDGSQKATIVSAAQQELPANGGDDDDDEDGAQFDHIRYKVLKSQQLIRNSILTTRNKKEAQFDGLIQYLQDYSFQELLSNNNVVIVEPVRTKIERPLTVGVNTAPTKPPRLASTVQKTTAAPKKVRQRQVGGTGAKRHFFYQPVRVNRELYEDELPDPDTVRNVRRFFEQHILPTPGQGILVQSQQKFGGSACQLSPKSRRARGYRYLTIDTSYGEAAAAAVEEQPKGMELLEEHKIKHWDNASLSSGISSGDLSSPCGECHNQPESIIKKSPVLACKGVHVLDVVRRHNSNAANAKARAKLASRRTWCVGGAIAAADSRYRQIYEHNLGQPHNSGDDAHDHNHADDDDDDRDVDDDDDDDVEADMCESYYVSNDVLAKIRECGSTVTYYGGRVLERQTPERMAAATMQTNQQLINGNAGNALSTRSRVRQIESCNVCPPTIQGCEHEQTEQQKQQQMQEQQDSYQGIKFKLVKSNSCSSRLELAGANDGDGDGDSMLHGDSEMVRKMVHHFECNQPMATTNDINLTINSQSTAAKIDQATARRQVTVNNHINVLREPGESQDVHDNPNDVATTKTYQSQAMNIRLDLSTGRGSSADKPSNNGKVCRNKNVDLAYTLVKQLPHSEAKSIVNPGTPNANQWSQLKAPDEQQIETKKLMRQPEINGREQIIVPIEIHQTNQQQQQQQQHPAASQERRLSNASSSASIVDKTVVRHYVANDKSIYERRKYDDIEFEEFEIYDPAKELERQQQEQEQSNEHTEQSSDSIDKRHTDGELYDSLDDRM
ncbi:GH16272 [Drosophila grimshawi]|uniref:GH16272 n=1 Tax=Drosophila grimshawi TaxID=7222 RepID=B4IXX0_DROGR|nr:GH16272 [Drosophila grimshawi]